MRVALVAVLAGAVLLSALLLLRSTGPAGSEDRAEHDGDGSEGVVSREMMSQLAPASDRPPESDVEPRAGGAPTQDATAASAADAGELEPGGAAHVSGFARDGQGAPLAGHRVEVEDADGRIAGRVVTGIDGGFRIDGLLPGVGVLRLLGPGDGDALGAFIQRPWAGACNAEVVQEERRLNLTLPPEGLERVAVTVPGHGARLIRFRVVDDIQRPLGQCVLQIDAAEGIRSIEVRSESVAISEEDGTVCLPLLVEREQSVRLTLQDDIGRETRALFAGEPEAADSIPRYLPVEVPVRAEPVVQDLGTVIMPRMAGLIVTIVDGLTGASVDEAAVRAECSGGGVPPSDERGLIDDEGRYWMWSERASGQYDLAVEADGYQPARRTGVLVAGDEPLPVEIALERSR